MHKRDQAGFPRTRPNIRTYNAVIDAHAHNGRLLEAEDMLRSMVDAYESSAARSMDGIEDEELPVRPDSFSFNTVIQRWARSRSPDGGKRAEGVLDLLLRFHNNGNSDVRPDGEQLFVLFHFWYSPFSCFICDTSCRAVIFLHHSSLHQRKWKTDS
jgi:pentatricopeptide repeat protein